MTKQPSQQKLRINVFLLLIFLAMSCNQNPQVDIQGHRGCRGLLPENSLLAFEKAIDIGVNTLELDIAITKGNKVIVSHEPFISRFTCYNKEGAEIPYAMDMQYNLYQMSYDEIKLFDCGTKFLPDYPDQKKVKTYKPLLSELFDLVKKKDSDVNFNIEIKSKPEYYGVYTPQPNDYVKLVLDEIDAHQVFNRVNLQSFDLTILEEIKKQSPNMKVALLVDEDEKIEVKLEKLSYKPEIISPYFKLLNSEVVAKYQSEGFKMIPWTVNNKRDMRKMLRWKVNGIITDYPDKLITINSK